MKAAAEGTSNKAAILYTGNIGAPRREVGMERRLSAILLRTSLVIRP